ncbi:hypothetical protein C8R48DRAFT_710742 [Suillus tomentosus]|nr:hypothetical protein C8R48DRAFT_710742 [Suillus tomentosus]
MKCPAYAKTGFGGSYRQRPSGNWVQPCSNHCNETSYGDDCCTKKIHPTLRQRLEFTHMDTRLLLTCEYRSVIHQCFNVNLEAGR